MSKEQNIYEKLEKNPKNVYCPVRIHSLKEGGSKIFKYLFIERKNIVEIARNANVYTIKEMFLFEIVLFMLAK